MGKRESRVKTKGTWGGRIFQCYPVRPLGLLGNSQKERQNNRYNISLGKRHGILKIHAVVSDVLRDSRATIKVKGKCERTLIRPTCYMGQTNEKDGSRLNVTRMYDSYPISKLNGQQRDLFY